MLSSDSRRGEVQAAKAAPSSEHSNDEPLSEAENSNVADLSVVWPGGAASMAVSGAVVSGGATIDHPYEAGDTSVLPAASTARTSKRCSPSARPLYSTPDAHGPNATPSSEHSN